MNAQTKTHRKATIARLQKLLKPYEISIDLQQYFDGQFEIIAGTKDDLLCSMLVGTLEDEIDTLGYIQTDYIYYADWVEAHTHKLDNAVDAVYEY